MASLPLRHHSPSSDHELLLHDFQGQESDHEKQDEDECSAENDKIPEDGGEKQGIHIYPTWQVGGHRESNLEDIKSKHQGHHLPTIHLRGTKNVSPYRSVPLLYHLEVRPSVYITLIFPLSYSSSTSTTSTSTSTLLLQPTASNLTEPPHLLSFTSTNKNTRSFIQALFLPNTFFVIVTICDRPPSLLHSLYRGFPCAYFIYKSSLLLDQKILQHLNTFNCTNL